MTEIVDFLKKYTDGKQNTEKVEISVLQLNRVIKALEQEPILDKIRAEIEQAADKQLQIAMGVSDLNERYAHIQMENAYRHSLNIIDKYKSESEVQNAVSN